jgi:HAD superfamily hydrolase (TIGR01509 family)
MIKTIIFDWGGVLTIGKYTQSILENISKRKKIKIEKIYNKFDKLIVQLNLGKINFKQFVKEVEKKLSLGISEKEMKYIFKNSIKPNKKVIPIIKKLKSKFNIIMLSDNDEVTVNFLKKNHKEMFNLFSKKYFSHELYMVKPNLKIYRHVLKDMKIKGSECIFIDDKQKNVDASIRLGMKGILFINSEQLKKELKNYI